MKVYVASPLGFSEPGRAFYGDFLIPHLKALGHVVLDPWSLTDRERIQAVAALPLGVARRDAWRTVNAEIGRTNMDAIQRADVVLAILDGSDVDSGTAAEVGYAFAKGKPIIGYRSDLRLAADNEGAVVNVQVDYFIRASGGAFIERVAQISSALTSFNTYNSIARR